MLITRPLQDSRWVHLAAFVATWYREPLAWPRGPRLERVDAQITEVEHRLGAKLPQGVREWFALAGHRLTDVNQDRPVRLAGGWGLGREEQELSDRSGTKAAVEHRGARHGVRRGARW